MVQTGVNPSAQQQDDTETRGRIMRFLRQHLDSFVKWDIVRFFHDNPYAVETADDVARALGREGEEVSEALKTLTASKVLTMKTVSGTAVFSLHRDPAVRALVHEFVIACDDRDFRAAAIQQVIDGLR
jgi:DNA-binding transcriptional ArsR family regulator